MIDDLVFAGVGAFCFLEDCSLPTAILPAHNERNPGQTCHIPVVGAEHLLWFAPDASPHVTVSSCLRLAGVVSQPAPGGTKTIFFPNAAARTWPAERPALPTTYPSAAPSRLSNFLESRAPPRDHVLSSRPRRLAMGPAILPPVVRLGEQHAAPRLRLPPAAEAGPTGPAPYPLHARALRVQEEQQGDEQVNNNRFRTHRQTLTYRRRDKTARCPPTVLTEICV